MDSKPEIAGTCTICVHAGVGPGDQPCVDCYPFGPRRNFEPAETTSNEGQRKGLSHERQ